MKKSLHVLAALLMLPTAAVSHAEDGRAYLGVQAGMFLPIKSSATGNFDGLKGNLTYDPGIVLTAVGGYELANGIRGEAELNFRYVATDRLATAAGSAAAESEIRAYGVMTNAYYDFRTRTAVTPYVGAGVGVVVVDLGKGTSNGTVLWSADREVSAAYQGIAGFSVRLTRQASLDFVYRHYAVPRIRFDTLAAELRGINLSAGIRCRF